MHAVFVVTAGAMCYLRDRSCLLAPFNKCREAPVELVGPPPDTESYQGRADSSHITVYHLSTMPPPALPSDGDSIPHQPPPESLRVSVQRVVQGPPPGSSKSVDVAAAAMRPRYAYERSSYSNSVAVSDSSQATLDRDEVFSSGGLVRLPPSATMHRPPLPDARRELQPAPSSSRRRQSNDGHSLASQEPAPFGRASQEPAPFGPVSFCDAEGGSRNLLPRRSPRDDGDTMWGSHLVPSIASADSGVLPDTLKPSGVCGAGRSTSEATSKPQGVLKRVLTLGRQPEDEEAGTPTVVGHDKVQAVRSPEAGAELALGGNASAAFEFELGRTSSVSGTLPSHMGGPLATLWSTALRTRSDVGGRSQPAEAPAVPLRSSTPPGNFHYAVPRSSQSVTAAKAGCPLAPHLNLAPRALSVDSAQQGERVESSPTSRSTWKRSQSARFILQVQQELQQSLHEDDMQIRSVLGKGGFGTVYRGAFCDSLVCL